MGRKQMLKEKRKNLILNSEDISGLRLGMIESATRKNAELGDKTALGNLENWYIDLDRLKYKLEHNTNSDSVMYDVRKENFSIGFTEFLETRSYRTSNFSISDSDWVPFRVEDIYAEKSELFSKYFG